MVTNVKEDEVYFLEKENPRSRRNKCKLSFKSFLIGLCFALFIMVIILVQKSVKNTKPLNSLEYLKEAAKLLKINLDKDPTTIVIERPLENQNITLINNNYNTNKPKLENAVIVILCRNEELDDIRRSIREFENRFNSKYEYPYVFLNEVPFSTEFIDGVSYESKSKMSFGLIPIENWSVPKFINETKLNQSFKEMKEEGVLHGDQLSYHHMCRFNSGFFYNHELLLQYDYYWRVEPGVKFFCDINYDPFKFMKKNNKKYGFTISLLELPNTIKSLWEETLNYMYDIGIDNFNTDFLPFFIKEYKTEEGYWLKPSREDLRDNFNYCHFWSNFEIASLNFFRSKEYQNYFEYLDQTGKFFYERWGDAPIHSIAAGLFLNTSEVHFFNDIGYQHDDFIHCPTLEKDNSLGFNKNLNCQCPKEFENFDTAYGSCIPHWNEYKPTPYKPFNKRENKLDFKDLMKQYFD